jgi:hypothetical protein
MSIQVKNMEAFLAWVKTCPCDFIISSMTGEHMHVKFTIPYYPYRKLNEEDNNEE